MPTRSYQPPATPAMSPADTGALARVYWSVHEASPDGFTLFEPVRDADGMLVDFTYAYVNPAGASMVGLTPAELIGQRMRAMFPSVVELGIFAGYAATSTTGDPWQFELRYDRDGVDCGFRLLAVRTASAHGGNGAVAVQYSDISARLLAEHQRDQLIRRAAQLQHITAALAAARTESEVAALVSAHVCDMVGAQHVSVLVAQHPDGSLRLVPTSRFPEHLIPAVEQIPRDRAWPAADAFRSGERVVVRSLAEMQQRFPDVASLAEDLGVTSTVSLPLRFDGSILGVMPVDFGAAGAPDDEQLSVLTEVAAQCAVALERVRLHAREIEARADLQAALDAVARLSREKSAFLAEVSHEVRTPLQSIASYSELLALGAMGALSDPQRDALRRIQVGTERIQHLIDDVLEFAQLEGGSVSLAMQRVDVIDVVQLAESLLTPRRTDAGLTFALAGPGETAVALADARRLQQIVLNLLSNAIKYTPAGGHIAVSVHREVDAWIEVAVRDSGPGIPPGDLESVFEPFVQLGPTSRAGRGAKDGVGLGLSISRQLARRMGGDLAATSVLGEGSTFTLRMPGIA